MEDNHEGLNEFKKSDKGMTTRYEILPLRRDFEAL